MISKRMKWILGASALCCAAQAGADIPMAKVPMAGVGASYGPNVALALSIEFPTAKQAYLDTNSFNTGKKYIGYFDPDKCYVYNTGGYFEPVGLVDNAGANNRSCGGRQWGGAQSSSGNLLNWATMSAIDIFRATLTGGNRAKGVSGTSADYTAGDSTAFTSLRRSKLTSDVHHPNNFSKTYSSWTFANDGWKVTVDGSSYNVVVQVCKKISGLPNKTDGTPQDGLESNCRAYPQTGGTVIYKPEGLIQDNGRQMRFAALSYLNDDNIDRMGGVLRARMKYPGVEPQSTKDGLIPLGAEWSDETGIYDDNPDDADASASGVVNSGVINYLNKFGDSSGYKRFDIAAELYYTALRYFRKMGSVAAYTDGMTAPMKDGFPAITNWDDPILSRCQKNFIVYIGDTNTHVDVALPGANQKWRGYDTVPPVPTLAKKHVVPTDDTEFNVASLLATMGIADSHVGSQLSPPYIAALAWWANTHPTRSGEEFEKVRVSTFMIDTVEGNNPKSETGNAFYLAAKFGGFNDSLNLADPTNQRVNMPGDKPDIASEWVDTTTTIAAYPSGVPRNFSQANNPESMRKGLIDAFKTFGEAVDPSMAAIASNQSEPVGGHRYTYQSSYEPKTWSGDLIARQMTTAMVGSGSSARLQVTHTEAWRAKTRLETQLGPTAGSRNVFTIDTLTRKGVNLNSAWFTALAGGHPQKTALNSGDSHGALRVAYLRGDRAQEGDSASPKFRKRAGGRLGDIVNSTPVYIPAPVGNPVGCAFGANDGTGTERDAILARKALLAVAANDGFLHGFDADTGDEKFAFLPSSIFAELPKLTDTAYAHQYFNDGSPKFANVCFSNDPDTGTVYPNPEAKTILVGTTGRGGRSVYALDVTGPGAMTKDNVLWEFSHADLGLTINDVQIVKLPGGKPAVLVSSGYNQTGTSQASLFVLSLDKKIGDAWAEGVNYFRVAVPDPGHTGAIIPNALGAPAGVDIDGSGTAGRVYAGDINGDLWRFDLTASSGTVRKIFTAIEDDDANNRQPIVAAPKVTRYPQPKGGFLIMFGTGRYFAQEDYNLPQQTLYGVIDVDGSNLGTTQTADLLKQTLGAEVGQAGDIKYFSSSQHQMQANHNGWYMDMLKNERATAAATLYNRTAVSFTSFVPGQGECDDLGTTWITALNMFSGALLSEPFYDTNGNGMMDTQDVNASRQVTANGVIASMTTVMINGKWYLCGAGQGKDGMICQLRKPYGSANTRQGWTEVNLVNRQINR